MKPTHNVFVACPQPGKASKDRWFRCGAAWEKVDNNGARIISIQIDLLPTGTWNGSLVLHPYKENANDIKE